MTKIKTQANAAASTPARVPPLLHDKRFISLFSLGLLSVFFTIQKPTISGAVRTKRQSTILCDRNSRHPVCCSPEHCEVVRNSTLYSECCDNLANGTVYSVLVTGTPRSGTAFTTNLVNALVGNKSDRVEHDWNNPTGKGMVSWIHVMREPHDEYYGPGKLEGNKFWAVWHQVRDPLRSLTSMVFSEPTDRPNYLQYLNRHITVEGWCFGNPQKLPRDSEEFFFDKYRCLLQQGLQFYLEWHRFIDRLGVPRFRLEDLVEEPHNLTLLDEIFESMELPSPDHVKALKVIQRDGDRNGGHSNSRRHRPTLEWWELCQADVDLTQRFLNLGHQYGYYRDVHDPCDQQAMDHEPTNWTKTNNDPSS